MENNEAKTPKRRRKSSSTDNVPIATKPIRKPSVRIYCRKCMETKPGPINFFDAVDKFLDSNGYMSICKSCIDEMFERALSAEQGNYYKATLKMCRTVNLAYLPEGVDATLVDIKKRGEDTPFFGIYKSRVSNIRSLTKDSSPLTFSEPTVREMIDLSTEMDVDNLAELTVKWGEGLSFEDYTFLERELSEWKRTHKSDTKAEETLLREICYKMLEIRRARIESKSTESLVKGLQDLMKTASVDPAKTAIAGGGASKDTFSAFIKMIEEKEPAEEYKDKELFKDVDNIEWYFKKFLTRPLKNFLGLSRDLDINSDDDELEIEEESEEGSEKE